MPLRKKYVTEKSYLKQRKMTMWINLMTNYTNNYYKQLELKRKCTHHIAKEFRPSSGLCNGTPNDMSRLLPKCPPRKLKYQVQPKHQNGTYTKNIVYKEVLGTITPYTYMAILARIINYLQIMHTNNITLLQISGLEDTPMQT
ncbi:hypothetical protein H5410_055164 [Solanum commersonii]|uniref:Uncharacterized protein n=1 Tax=Solanum commersonii TaxID=4109 RepID=A0A9J5WJJ2_SOLCO|nr:hypothetical protein H5410_055164 [Solanum commersonii]